jgi:predicted acetyltransferase
MTGRNNMDFRFIKEDEQEQVIFVMSQAFYYDCEIEYKLVEKGKFRYDDFLGAFDEGGKLMAVTQLFPLFMWLDGASVKCGGIGNVASLPEGRRGGIVRKIMKLLCDKMYEDGYTMSYLYPFSHSYYRKFGYEFCYNARVFGASPKGLLEIEFHGEAKQFKPGENGTAPGEIIEIYNTFASKFNVMLDRDAWQWEQKLEHDPVLTKTRTYIVYGKDKKANAYFTYAYDRQKTTTLTIRDMAWTDTDGMYNLFAFLGKFFGNVTKVVFDVPPDLVPEYLWKEPLECEITRRPSGMGRVINAKKALEIIKKPAGSGSFTIKIDDPFMEQNNKAYKVSWKNEKSEASEFQGECDIECSAMALSQIVTGFVGLDLAESRRDVKINGNKEMLFDVFKKKMIYMADFF